eukprot:TRINITY_DN15575_c0_g1_i1.p1 TRINITY_DN15575_c0_g1~~TRINITY_DN15575_c0_g1_i1.p1  ORF type:complete len:582 (+),score=218.00 TRINITY_DN15575_c0_g1_i1:212-1957(+)
MKFAVAFCVIVALATVSASYIDLDLDDASKNAAVHPKVKAAKVQRHRYVEDDGHVDANGRTAGAVREHDAEKAASLLRAHSEHHAEEDLHAELQRMEHKFMLKRIASQKKRAEAEAARAARQRAMQENLEEAKAELEMKKKEEEVKRMNEEIHRREELFNNQRKLEAEEKAAAEDEATQHANKAALVSAKLEAAAERAADLQRMRDVQAAQETRRRQEIAAQRRKAEEEEREHHAAAQPAPVPSLFKKAVTNIVHPSPEAQKEIADTLSNVLEHVLHVEDSSDEASKVHSAVEHGLDLGREIADDILRGPEPESDDDDAREDAEDVNDTDAQDSNPDSKGVPQDKEDDEEEHVLPLHLELRPRPIRLFENVPHVLHFPGVPFDVPRPPMFPEHMRPFPFMPLPPLPLMASGPAHPKMLVLWPPHFNPAAALEDQPPVPSPAEQAAVFPRIMSLVNKLTALRPRIAGAPHPEPHKAAPPRELHIHGQTTDGRDCQCKCTAKTKADAPAQGLFKHQVEEAECEQKRRQCFRMCATRFTGAKVAQCNSRCNLAIRCADAVPNACQQGCAKVPNPTARALCLKQC